MKRVSFVLLLIMVVSSACQTNNESMYDAAQVDDLKEVRLSEFKALDSLNEDFEHLFSEEEELDIVRELIKSTQKSTQRHEELIYDYDVWLVYDDNVEKGIHLGKNDNDEIVLKYIGESTDEYVVSEKASRKLIDLIY
ncbi:hypothetical protein MM221_08990 [Salipaludibacillus sp. LMS25]|uniref:hypothetical protein n=1 Tax=Salipaludibacillus sp. LMS25 TaxID=2924031 RepID=UPI0020D11585|nr:hypothetical protein [Salipaludibacillus sp. LMS25]UTR16638.1 hypothetical protein MM221_08990 [Salipaludibacillus sp. LMS25]